MVLDIRDFRALGDLPDRQNVPDVQGRGRTTLDELSGMDSLRCDNERFFKAWAGRLFENQLGERCAASGVVEERLDDPDNLRRPLRGVDRAELSRPLAVVRVCLEYVPVALSLRAEDVAHQEGRP
jgi:hypothetical protein